MIGADRMTLHKELIAFMDSLHDTVFRLKKDHYIYPTFDNNKSFGDYFDNKRV
jgi:hypothetical protein